MTSVIAFVITVNWLRCEANCQALLCGDDLYVMAIEIKIEYSYYSTKRITPVYIVEEELMSLEYSKFVERIVNEVRHLRRMNLLRLIVKEDETDDTVDLSRKYFSLQMNGLLDKGAKNIRIRVFEFASPAVDAGIHSVENMAEAGAEDRELLNTDACSTLTKFTNRPGNIIVSGLPPPSMILSMMICLRSEDKGFPGI